MCINYVNRDTKNKNVSYKMYKNGINVSQTKTITTGGNCKAGRYGESFKPCK